MKLKIIFLCVLFLTFIGLFSNIEHNHLLEYSLENDDIEVAVSNVDAEIISIEILVKSLDQIDYTAYEMVSINDLLIEFTIPCNSFEITGPFQYYFKMELQDGEIVTLPATNPQINPYQSHLHSDSQISEDFILLTPDDEFTTGEMIFAISLYNISDEVNIESIKVLDNNRNVTSKSEISSNMIVYNAGEATGKHDVKVEIKDIKGMKIQSPTWSFGNAIEKEKFIYSGDVALRTKYYSETYKNDDEEEDDSESRTDLTLNFKGSYKFLDVKSRVFVSSLEDEEKQPVNRYRLQMLVPHFNFIGGDHTPNYNSLIATGKNIRGIHGKLFFPGFAILTSIGSSQRKIDGEKEANGYYTAGTFKRSALAVRTELGSQRNFMVGLNFTKSKDKVSSLNKKYYLSKTDSTHIAQPKDNLVLGLDTRLALMNQHLVWGNEFALSLYNDDIIGGAIPKDSLEAEFDADIPFDPESFEDIFVINKNVEPIIPTLSSMAYKTYLKFIYRSNLLNISYRGVGTSYRALSANYLGQDSRVFSIFDNLNLMRNRLNLSFGYNYVSDNLYDEKEETTSSNNIFTQIYYRPADLPYVGFSYNGFSASNTYSAGIEEDSLAFNRGLDLNSNNFNIYTGYEIKQIIAAPTTVNINFGQSSYKDEENGMFDYSKQSIGISANSRFSQLPLKTVLSYTYSKNENTISEELTARGSGETTENTYHSIALKGIMKFVEEKVNPYLNLRYTTESGEYASNALYFVLGSTYKAMKQLVLSGETAFKQRSFDGDYGDYNRFTLKFKIKYKF